MDITNMYLTHNRPYTKRSKTTAIACHYVGNPHTSAEANRNYFQNTDRKVSSNYIIGLQGEIICCIPDNEVSWCTNQANSYTVSIEACHPDKSGKFTEATYNSYVELVAMLCNKYNLNPLKGGVIRHYDVTKKICPKYWVDHPDEWDAFKQDVYDFMRGNITKPSKPEQSKPKPNFIEPVVWQNGSTKENAYSDNALKNRIGSLSQKEKADSFGKYNGKTLVVYDISGGHKKAGFVKYAGKNPKKVGEWGADYQNGSTPETVYSATDLSDKIGSLDAYEKCKCLAKYKGKYLVCYKVNGTNTYKTGFVKYNGKVD